MSNILTRLPSLARDYSGACSALFALPSLNLLYSPGGCSSAVIECDEIRDLRQTLFFGSKLGEMEAVMGAEEEFLFQAERLWVQNRQAELIAIMGTPVSALTGVDIGAIADRLSRRTGLPSLALPTEGFETYYSGVYHTLLTLGKRFLERRAKINNQVNILGYTPLSLGKETHLSEFIDQLGEFGLQINGLVEKNNLETFKEMSSAALNLVVSHEGVGLAQYMQKEYSIPYVLNVPVGLSGMQQLFQVLAEIVDISPSYASKQRYALTSRASLGQRAVVIGEPLFASCLASCLRKDFGIDYVESISLMKMDRRMKQVYLEKALSDVHLFESEEGLARWMDKLQPDIIVGDPLYQRLLSKGCTQYVPMPHVGLSGPLYADAQYEFIGRRGYDYLAGYIKV
ncbi:nitrogenase component 1 [Desulfosporosinus hippei]|uniref:Nitrogenase molybdenum-iron protein, alpha and beta chains n=1 Tax=Desulfosporosinus hippei DSM 8344 TaxID=1121419 RepID=A0A1G7T3H7_9FIRM|nr:nitrogenase component 1 [Desulfosporosinus hippei]SDG29781.1 Nitrogenase molybdenum-iron protein, alpha and beta chains [Desulfosporosinus hippei DSM 8344]